MQRFSRNPGLRRAWRWPCLALALGVSLAHAQPLSLAGALERAEARSQQLVAHDAAERAAREQAVAVGQRPDPVLRAGVSNLPIDGADRFSVARDFMTMRSIGVMQEFTRADKRRARTERHMQEAELARATRALARSEVRRETAVAWLNLHLRQRLHRLLEAQRAEATLLIDAADAAYRGGRGPQTDVFAARAARARVDDHLHASRGEIAVARARLARWVGEAAAQPLGEAPALDVAADAARPEPWLARHPALQVAAQREGLAQADAEVARREREPDWSVELMLSQRGSAFSNMASLTVALPLPWQRDQRQDREWAARQAQVVQARAEREEMARELVLQQAAWHTQWLHNHERLARYDGEIVPLAAQRSEAALTQYRSGSGSLSGVVDARREAIDTAIERLRLELETAALWAQLTFTLSAGDDAGVAAKEQS